MRCKYLDNQLCINPDGQYRFCCISKEPDNKENIKTHTPQEWFESSTHKNAKKQFERGEWPDACEVCRKKEELGLESQRSRPRKYGPGISNLDIRFGNSCNLKCLSCYEKSSSSIAQEAIQMKEQNLIPVYNILENPNFNWADNDTIDKILDLPIQQVYLTGGEPTMAKHLPDFLEKLDKDVLLRFNTNATVWNYKLEKILKQFKRVTMSMSIDAIGKKIEYIRYGSDWKLIEENYKKYSSFCKVNITSTISILNAPYMDELFEWANKNKINVDKNLVDRPEWLNVKNAPENLKPLFKHVDNWSEGEADPLQIKIFKDKITRLDKFRKINIVDYLPEVAKAYDLD